MRSPCRKNVVLFVTLLCFAASDVARAAAPTALLVTCYRRLDLSSRSVSPLECELRNNGAEAIDVEIERINFAGSSHAVVDNPDMRNAYNESLTYDYERREKVGEAVRGVIFFIVVLSLFFLVIALASSRHSHSSSNYVYMPHGSGTCCEATTPVALKAKPFLSTTPDELILGAKERIDPYATIKRQLLVTSKRANDFPQSAEFCFAQPSARCITVQLPQPIEERK